MIQIQERINTMMQLTRRLEGKSINKKTKQNKKNTNRNENGIRNIVSNMQRLYIFVGRN